MISRAQRVFCLSLSLTMIAAFTKTNCQATESEKRPHLDIAFCIDTTASMQSEIEMVKSKTKSLVAKLSTGKPAPIVRVGLVAYRDRGDEYVTKLFPFTDNIDKVVKDISNLKADGGGDGPESVNEGLHVAVHDLKWSDQKGCAKLLFLIGDAPPHAYSHDFNWSTESKNAASSGIQINTIACKGLEDYSANEGVDVFKKIAKQSDGQFEMLAYRQVAEVNGKPKVIVTKGRGVYDVDTRAADWKSAVASGRMTKLPDSLSTPYATAASAAYPAASAAPAPIAFAAGMSLGCSMMKRAGVAGAAMESSSRAESNLDEIVLNAAKAKALKELNVHY